MNVKVIVPLAFALGVGGGTAGVVLTRPPVVAADSLHAPGDSLHPAGDSAAVNAPGDSSLAPADGGAVGRDTTKAAVDTGHAAPAATHAAAPTGAAPAPVKSDSAPFDAARIAKAVGGLEPVDAAMMLQPMDDAKVAQVLRDLGVRRSGPILKQFPAARAERLGRTVITGMEKLTP